MQTNEILSFFAKQIEAELGIIYAEHNYFQLEMRLTDIAKALGLATLSELHTTAQSGIHGKFRQLLMDSATNNETSFFRDPRIFQAIENTILKERTNSAAAAERFLIWSAASSSGQEALSTAMLILEYNEKNSKKIEFSIVATDISDRILARAQEAKYSELEVQRGLSPALIAKYFTKENDRWQAVSALRSRIEYKRLNLKDAFQFAHKLQMILCRNVLIYQSVEGKKEVIKRLHAALAPGGFLILGAGESLIGLSDDFKQRQIEGVVLYQKAG